jgi:hypothetical protein
MEVILFFIDEQAYSWEMVGIADKLLVHFNQSS